MSFDYPQQRPRRRKGGMSGIVMLLIIGGVFSFSCKAAARQHREVVLKLSLLASVLRLM